MTTESQTGTRCDYSALQRVVQLRPVYLVKIGKYFEILSSQGRSFELEDTFLPTTKLGHFLDEFNHMTVVISEVCGVLNRVLKPAHVIRVLFALCASLQ